MKKILATTAFALTFAAGAVSAQSTLSGIEDVTCAQFFAMDLADQQAMLNEVIGESDGGSSETTLGDLAIVCNGNDDVAIIDALDT